ncbi:MAG: hypothetical protein OXR73_00835 [Myxococcales bacterium]|nr:hypothetical protein [Myxococcales bacterium]
MYPARQVARVRASELNVLQRNRRYEARGLIEPSPDLPDDACADARVVSYRTFIGQHEGELCPNQKARGIVLSLDQTQRLLNILNNPRTYMAAGAGCGYFYDHQFVLEDGHGEVVATLYLGLGCRQFEAVPPVPEVLNALQGSLFCPDAHEAITRLCEEVGMRHCRD